MVNSLPAYYAKQYVKFPTFFNNPIGRAMFEEDTNSLHNVSSGGNANGVRWSGGTRNDGRTPNWQDYPRSGNTPDNFYGGDQFKELVRALFNQELMARIDGPSSVISKWRDPADGRKWCSTIKEKLYRWKNDPDVIGSVLPTDTDGKADFSTTDIMTAQMVSKHPWQEIVAIKQEHGHLIIWKKDNILSPPRQQFLQRVDGMRTFIFQNGLLMRDYLIETLMVIILVRKHNSTSQPVLVLPLQS